MNLSRPTNLVFLISLVLAAIAALNLLGIVAIPIGGLSMAWVALIAWAVLAAGNLLPRL